MTLNDLQWLICHKTQPNLETEHMVNNLKHVYENKWSLVNSKLLIIIVCYNKDTKCLKIPDLKKSSSNYTLFWYSQQFTMFWPEYCLTFFLEVIFTSIIKIFIGLDYNPLIFWCTIIEFYSFFMNIYFSYIQMKLVDLGTDSLLKIWL